MSDDTENLTIPVNRNPMDTLTSTTKKINGVKNVDIDGETFSELSEGQGKVLIPSCNQVFYNPVQEFNRDISITVLRLFASQFMQEKNTSRKRKRQQISKSAEAEKSHEKKLASTSSENNGAVHHSTDLSHPMDVTESSDDASHVEYPLQNSGLWGGHDAENRRNNISSMVASQKTIENEINTLQATQETVEDTLNSRQSPEPVVTWQVPKVGVQDEKGLRILEALAATGLRSIRYAKEIPGVKEIIANDLSQQAVECMKRSIKYNNVDHLVTASHGDASLLLYTNRGRGCGEQFDVIDLDPYGSPHLFLDGAVQAVSEGGLLLVTCTDMAVLCGNSPDTCHAKYGATSFKTKGCHEVALRIALQCLESHANRYGRYIEPLLSLSADFYIRLAVRVRSSALKVKESYAKVGMMYRCVGCDVITTSPLGNIIVDGRSVKHRLTRAPPVQDLCEHCDSKHEIGGPIWLGPLHNQSFLDGMLSMLEGGGGHVFTRPLGTHRRIMGVVQMMREELQDVPLYYVHDRLCQVAGVTVGKLARFKSALLNAGYRVSSSHCHKTSIKTDAPAKVVWDVVRAHERTEPALRMRADTGAPGCILLNKPSSTEVSRQLVQGALKEARKFFC
ncbi:tRNA methyltransferase Trm1 [Trinorchestia longiramus]|nr:tRNA methyltransferase Trm1 [Trinorchestia longiramus]